VWPKKNGSEFFRKLAELSKGGLELLLPPTCGACGIRTDPTAALCPTCDARLGRIKLRTCQLCQETAPQTGGRFCAGCGMSDSPLTACIAAVRFEGGGAEWIHRFKYPKKGLRGLDPVPASVVGAMLREAAARAPGPQPDLVVPVPLHPRRLRLRGFNPAAQIARSLAREFEIPFDAVALCRTRDTPSQTAFDRRERHRNVRGAFRSRSGQHVPKRIWLVDDVVTTTSTLAEAATALRTAGASTVIGLCAARALLDVSSAVAKITLAGESIDH
jgi:ComF family protein